MTLTARWVALPLVLFATFLAFLPAGAFGWVYDDHRFVENNPSLDGMAAEPWRALDPATTSMDGAEPGMWRPLRTLSYAVDRAAGGTSPRFAHFHSVLLHGTAAALVCAIALALEAGAPLALAAGLLFGLHPVQVESAAWISSRGDLLSAVLLLAAVLLHLRRRAVLACAAVGLAFVGKESAIVAPLLLTVADLAAGGMTRVRERHRVVMASAGVLLGLVAVRWAVLSGVSTFGQGGGLGLGVAGTLEMLPSMFGHYIARVLVPVPPTFDLQLAPSTALGLLPLALAVGLVLLRRPAVTRPAVAPMALAVLWAAAALLPVTLLQLLFPLKILVADRFLYLALAGPAVALPLVLGRVLPSPRAASMTALALAGAMLPVQMATLAPWRSDEALWTEVLRREPGHPRALYAMAETWAESNPDRALHAYAAYLDQVPGDAGAWYRRGTLEERRALAATGDGAAVARNAGLLAATASYLEAISLWADGEPEGRARGFAAARLARAAILGTLGREEAAAMEAMEAMDAWSQSPPEVREALLPRCALVRRWAASAGRTEVVDRVDAAMGGKP